MKTKVLLFVSRSILAILLIVFASCGKDPISAPSETYTLRGRVTFPDGTPIERVFIELDLAQTHTDTGGHYQILGVTHGRHSFIAGGDYPLGLVARTLYVQSDVVENVLLGPARIEAIQSEYRDSLILRRFSPTDLRLGANTDALYGIGFYMEGPFQACEWTAYKIPVGTSWAGITKMYLDSCRTPKVNYDSSAVGEELRTWYGSLDGFVLHVPPKFFLDCTNGIAFMSTMKTSGLARVDYH